MELLGALATGYRKFIPHLGSLGGPKWLRNVWQLEMRDGSRRVALVLDRAFRKRLEVDDSKLRDQLARYDFKRVLVKKTKKGMHHRMDFAHGLFWSEYRAIPKSANARDLIFFHNFPEGDYMPTPKWRVVNVNNRKALLDLLSQLD